MLFEDSISNVDDESEIENNPSGKDPMMSDEVDEDEVKHGPFEFLHNDEVLFSRLLFDPTV
jgi:hypothetical protein